MTDRLAALTALHGRVTAMRDQNLNSPLPQDHPNTVWAKHEAYSDAIMLINNMITGGSDGAQG